MRRRRRRGMGPRRFKRRRLGSAPAGKPRRKLSVRDRKKLRALKRDAGKAELAVAAAREMPRRYRGKKVPPFMLVPPRDSDGKKVRHQWHEAAKLAELRAARRGRRFRDPADRDED